MGCDTDIMHSDLLTNVLDGYNFNYHNSVVSGRNHDVERRLTLTKDVKG